MPGDFSCFLVHAVVQQHDPSKKHAVVDKPQQAIHRRFQLRRRAGNAQNELKALPLPAARGRERRGRLGRREVEEAREGRRLDAEAHGRDGSDAYEADGGERAELADDHRAYVAARRKELTRLSPPPFPAAGKDRAGAASLRSGLYTYSALYERRRFRRSALDAEPRVSNSHARRYFKSLDAASSAA